MDELIKPAHYFRPFKSQQAAQSVDYKVLNVEPKPDEGALHARKSTCANYACKEGFCASA